MKKLLVLILPFILIVGFTNDTSTESADAKDPKSGGTQGEAANETHYTDTSDATETESNDAAGKNKTAESESSIASPENRNTEKSNSEGSKEDYTQGLKKVEAELALLEEQAQDGTQTDMSQAEQEIFEKWDDALNDVYNALEEQLSEEEMEALREEQRDWIKHRDRAAEEAASQFEGGSLEAYEHASVMAKLTKERCYELVESYLNG